MHIIPCIMDEKSDTSLDLAGAKHDVWLVKVPKYLAKKWINAPEGAPVGKLRISKNAGRTEVNYSMDKSLESIGVEPSKSIATEHKFVLQGAERQSLSIFSTTPAKAGQKRCMEGRVVQKVDCRPIVSSNYMQLKRTQMIEAARPKRITQQLSSAVKTTFKPVSVHKEEREYEQQKKSEGKKTRLDKEDLESLLFGAFEKHQYYNIKDLQEITKQPLVHLSNAYMRILMLSEPLLRRAQNYLKEVLGQIGMYNKHPGHRHMWELKPEYRHHHKSDDSTDDAT